ncbi:uncharacterized protein NPIL_543531 [Nephila pilipes]|uniref:MYND-type domain-containing protein n=1 Tax=Nephila pilipes TaxID=299642 RepID=A0A8X6MV17_NEPPI|nr:uncharacterized protein NPIL_543531 [Nephila pilipes]
MSELIQWRKSLKMENLSSLMEECGKHCHVLLERLSEEEIQRFTSGKVKNITMTEADDSSDLQQKSNTKHLLRDASYVNSVKFANYKRSRQYYLYKKSHRSPPAITDFSEFSSEETDMSSGEEFMVNSSNITSKPPRKKRKKLPYEVDFEWNPNSDVKCNQTNKRFPLKSKRGLKFNPRRKRIESNSSSSDDDMLNYYYDSDHGTKSESDGEHLTNLIPDNEIYDPDKVNVNIAASSKKKLQKVSNVDQTMPKSSDEPPSELLDSDVLSKIMQEMEDFNKKNKKQVNKVKTTESVKSGNSHMEAYYVPNVKKRQSRVFKITDEGVTPSLSSVQTILKNMVNAVCSSEKKRLAAIEYSKKKKCKWCEVLLSSKNENDELCTSCKNVGKKSCNISINKNVKKERAANVKVKTGKNKIKNKLLKNLPKYDQQRLVYSGKADKLSVGKGYNHCKSFMTPKDVSVAAESSEVEHTPKDTTVSGIEKTKVRKKKIKSNIEQISTLKIAKKKEINPKEQKSIDTIKPIMPISISRIVNKSDKKTQKLPATDVDKSLFFMTFPDQHKELEIPPEMTIKAVCDKNMNEKCITDVTTQIQLDSSENKAKQSVINNVQYGTYLLPPVPTVVVANYAATDAKSGDYYLSSVYYQNEMTRLRNVPQRNENGTSVIKSVGLPSMPSIEQLSNIPPVSDFPHVNSLSTSNANINISENANISALINQQLIAHSNISSPYSSHTNNISNILDSSLNISSDAFQRSLIASDSNISSLLNNTELQIEPLSSKNSNITYNSFGNQELNLAVSYEENSSLSTQDYNEDNLEDSNKGSLCGDLNFTSLDNISEEPISPTKQLESADKSDITEQGDKICELSEDQSSSADINPEENISYQSETEELSSEALLENCSTELDAICILGVVDLDRNPKWALSRKIESNKSECEKLKETEILNDTEKEKLKLVEVNGKILEIARSLLNKYGSFTRLAGAMLRKARLLEIKKEKNLEHGERSSCQFAQRGQIQPLLSQDDPSRIKDNMASTTGLQNACNFGSQTSESINHIEKIQTQIQAMRESSALVEGSAHLGVVHHFPAPGMSTSSNVTMSLTPRTEMMNEFRETPSRGSGPRTPARPESAMSQNDESVLTPLQIKKEKLETNSTSPLSQCAFSQNNSSSRLSISTPNASQLAPPMNNLALAMTPTNTQAVNTLSSQRLQNVASNVPINNGNSHIQNMMQFQQVQGGPPNVTVPFPSNSNFSKVLVNIASKSHPPSSTVASAMNPNNSNTNVVLRNGQLYNVQQVFIPGTTNVSQRYAQSSTATISNHMSTFNLYKQTVTSGGTMLVNSIGQNAYSIPTNVATPVLNPQQVSQVCNSSNYQQTMQHVPSPVNQSTSNAALLMPNKQDDSSVQMSCAVCKKVATLRCKQCAKVAYCNTACAKNYWHSKHKMECKLMTG